MAPSRGLGLCVTLYVFVCVTVCDSVCVGCVCDSVIDGGVRCQTEGWGCLH
jgi:hypothetical protein